MAASSSLNLRCLRKEKALLLLLFLVPSVGLTLLFSIYPAVNLVTTSFTRWDGFSEKRFVGWRNYIKIFKNPEILGALKVNLWFVAGGLLQVLFAIYFAVVINEKYTRGARFFKAIFVVPFVLNSVATVFIFKLFFLEEGTLNYLLHFLGFSGLTRMWLSSEPALALLSLTFVAFWRGLGFNMIVALGALQAVPQDLYEAGKIDGTNAWSQFFHITLPFLRPTIFMLVMVNLTWSLAAFEIPFILTAGLNGTKTVAIWVVDTAFDLRHFGLASALSTILLLLNIGVVSLQNLFGKGEDI